MSEIFDWSLRKVLEVSASDSPTPGGGSVSAMVGSLGTAMVAMVGNLTVGKEKYKDVEPKVQEILTKAKDIMTKLEELVDKDIAEFGNFMDVLKMPKDTEEQKAKRAELMQKALVGATDTPLEIARVCLEALKIAEELSTIGNKGAISDVGVGAYVAEAALNSVLLSVDINIPSIKDQEYVAKALAEKNRLIVEAKALREKAVSQVQDRMK
ncbi:cyclodeaminase/cyclohydrolase family protein [Zhaonella formicivorans]|uniref:cyclodeaminase/cyclohydrolase family protein n=1 Tax=Zhaonella formicivorans TaxID=2528593 RepID=UPI0010CF77EA|nr:cyclodeaminase/cyclohydrolase family protein [Zhaonella formicivorans]